MADLHVLKRATEQELQNSMTQNSYLNKENKLQIEQIDALKQDNMQNSNVIQALKSECNSLKIEAEHKGEEQGKVGKRLDKLQEHIARLENKLTDMK